MYHPHPFVAARFLSVRKFSSSNELMQKGGYTHQPARRSTSRHRCRSKPLDQSQAFLQNRLSNFIAEESPDSSVARAEVSAVAGLRARGLIVDMPDVLFDTGKYTLKPGARERLAKVAEI